MNLTSTAMLLFKYDFSSLLQEFYRGVVVVGGSSDDDVVIKSSAVVLFILIPLARP